MLQDASLRMINPPFNDLIRYREQIVTIVEPIGHVMIDIGKSHIENELGDRMPE